MDVVFKEGKLYLQAVKFGKKTWQKIWMVCFKPSSTGVGRLEIYPRADNNTISKMTGRLKSQARKVVRLSDCLSVTSAPKETCPTDCEAFYLNTTSETYTLASSSTQEWISVLCLLAFQRDPEDVDKGAFDKGNCLIMEDNDLYSSWESGDSTPPPKGHHVTVHATEASQKCNLSGNYVISPENDALLLLDLSACNIVYRWPYRTLRKYGQVKGGFSIEAGRHCESGEGKFVFLSKQAQHIFDTISLRCSEKTSVTQRPCTRLPCDQSTVHPSITTDPSGFQDLASLHSVDKSLHYYCNLPIGFKPLSVDPAHSGPCGGAAAEPGEVEDDPGFSFDTECLDYSTEEGIYYNMPRPVAVQAKEQSTGDLYYYVDKEQNKRPLVPASRPVPKPRYHLHQASTNSMHPCCGAQTQVMDKVTEEEGIISTGQITPSETPASFKHHLAEIISKDLAKFQAPAPPGGACLTYPQ